MTRQLVEKYLRAARADGLRPTTIKWYQSLLLAFVAWSDSRQLQTVTADDLRDYIIDLRTRESKFIDAPQKPEQHGALSESTINGHITALHAFWSWVSREYGTDNPMKNIRRPKRRNPTPKAISAADYVALFNAAGDDDISASRTRALLAVLADTGCRLGGLLSLTWSNVDLIKRRAVVVEKGGKSRNVSFTSYTARLLMNWKLNTGDATHVFVSLETGQPLTESGVNQLLKRLKNRAGVKGRVNPHSFRHNFAREYIRNGGDISTLAKLLGHSDINTTMMYYAIFTEDELADMHDQFSPMNQLKGAVS